MCLKANGISSLVAGIACNCKYNRLPEDEPSGSKHVEDIAKKSYNISFVGLFYTIILQSTVQKNLN